MNGCTKIFKEEKIIKNQKEENTEKVIKEKSKKLNIDKIQIKEYEKDYSEESFWNKIKEFGLKIGAKPIYVALLLYYALPKASLINKAIIIGALGYLICPFDIIPDAIPFIGFMDDMAILMLAFYNIGFHSNNEIKQKTKKELSNLHHYFI